MMSQAQREVPHECCGMLGGKIEEVELAPGERRRIGLVHKLYPLVNEAASPVAYRVAEHPSLFAAMRDMRQHELEVLAVYHSHPTTEPLPSKTDREQWHYEGSVCLIIAPESAEPQVRAWWLESDRIAEAEWLIIGE
jgi:proteasome lid subunit RPN8/RPN11